MRNGAYIINGAASHGVARKRIKQHEKHHIGKSDNENNGSNQKYIASVSSGASHQWRHQMQSGGSGAWRKQAAIIAA